MPEEKLYLRQFAARRMAERATKIVCCEPVDAGFASVLSDHVPDSFLRQGIRTSMMAFDRRTRSVSVSLHLEDATDRPRLLQMHFVKDELIPLEAA